MNNPVPTLAIKGHNKMAVLVHFSPTAVGATLLSETWVGRRPVWSAAREGAHILKA